MTGRLGAVSLAALVRHLCLRAGMLAQRIYVSGLWGAVEGYVIDALESSRASITTLAWHFGFDAVETGGVIRLKVRGRAAVAELGPADLVAAPDPRAEGLELTRARETELPQALKWQLARADEDYDAHRSRRSASRSRRAASPPKPSRWPSRPTRPSAAAAAR